MVLVVGAVVVTSGAALAVAVGNTAIAGAVGSGSAVATAGAATAAASGTAMGGAAAGTAIAEVAGTVATIASGPIGWCVVGASATYKDDSVSYDCWRSVLHDNDTECNNGLAFKDLVSDHRVKKIEFEAREGLPPQFLIENIWEEIFDLVFVTLPCGTLALHAEERKTADFH